VETQISLVSWFSEHLLLDIEEFRMYWSFEYNKEKYISWGSPRIDPWKTYSTNIKERYDIKVYSGDVIKPNESVIWAMQGSTDLGMGDTIWLCNFLRDIYRIKARRRCNFKIVSGDWVHKFYSHFLPKSFEMVKEYITEDEFMSIEHKLPSMYYWHDIKTGDNSDRSWLDNRSIIERLYAWSGMEYDGLSDWGEFTDEELLYPSDSFWTNLGLKKKDRYIYFQWHSSGHSKNLPPKTNIKILKHLVKNYGYKVYVIGRLRSLDILNEIDGVINLSGKTEGNAEALFTLAFNSEFIVCPDSAGVHLGEAYKIPSVCIMGTLPPSYICSKYKIPSFMYGNGACPYRPCGIVHQLPKQTKCPPGTGDYCKVFDDIDLNLLDRCIEKSFDNRLRYRSSPNEDFYKALNPPISLYYHGLKNKNIVIKEEKKEENFCLLLTATIDPKGCIITSRKDPKVREQDYIDALKKWLSFTSLPIVFCENSMYDLSRIKNETKEYSDRIEFIQFDGNKSADKMGKGIGELKIILNAIISSDFIKKSKNIVKVTGRSFVNNFDRIISSFEEDTFVQYSVDNNINNYKTIQTIIFIFKKPFVKYLMNRRSYLDDSKLQFFEKMFLKCINDAEKDGHKCVSIDYADYEGYSGGDNTPYKIFINQLSEDSHERS